MVSGILTVLFEEPFWIGIYERRDEGRYEVCKVTFGGEPKDAEVYEFILRSWGRLHFSRSVRDDGPRRSHSNPKRMQREISSRLRPHGVGTKAQQTLKQQEQAKAERRTDSRRQCEAEKERRFALRQQKRKEKHRGH